MMNLQYHYAVVEIDTGECFGCLTKSFEVINDAYILVPSITNDYVGKFYNRQDEHWYADAAFTQPLPELDW